MIDAVHVPEEMGILQILERIMELGKQARPEAKICTGCKFVYKRSYEYPCEDCLKRGKHAAR